MSRGHCTNAWSNTLTSFRSPKARSFAGVDEALLELQRLGVVTWLDHGFIARWVVAEESLPDARRRLMRLDGLEAQMLYRAGRRWRALAATSLKNWRMALASPASIVESETPMRRHPIAPTFR
jgi:hypothetical protein